MVGRSQEEDICMCQICQCLGYVRQVRCPKCPSSLLLLTVLSRQWNPCWNPFLFYLLILLVRVPAASNLSFFSPLLLWFCHSYPKMVELDACSSFFKVRLDLCFIMHLSTHKLHSSAPPPPLSSTLSLSLLAHLFHKPLYSLHDNFFSQAFHSHAPNPSWEDLIEPTES